MKLWRLALRSLRSNGVPQRMRTLSTYAPFSGEMGDRQNFSSFESMDDFTNRVMGDSPSRDPKEEAFFAKLNRLGRTPDGFSASDMHGGNHGGSHEIDGLDETINTLSDGMDRKLKRAATDFQYDEDEVCTNGYIFRPDTNYFEGGNYEPKDLDLTKPAFRQPPKRSEFETTTEEVLRKADFRNVRFLANFITEAGILKKRSQTKISAKAQRKIAREIKTARDFGLMPFTTMGTKSFVFGKTMENLDADFEYESYENPTADDGLGYM